MTLSHTELPTDHQLAHAIQSGDQRAFHLLVQRHESFLLSVAVKILRHRQDAEDCVQEALLIAFSKAHTFRHDCAIRGWLRSIVVNCCLARIRKVKRSPLLVGCHEDFPEFSQPDFSGPTIAKHCVLDGLGKVKIEFSQAVIALDIFGFPCSEAAHILGIPTGTVKSRAARGRKALASSLAEAA